MVLKYGVKIMPNTYVWFTVGEFFSTNDVNKVSSTEYSYENLAPLKGVTLTQMDESSDTYNPHPNAHLSSGVTSSNNVVSRNGGPPSILVDFDPSVLPHDYTAVPLSTRDQQVSFDLYIPSRADGLSTEVSTNYSNDLVIFKLYWFSFTSYSSASSSYFTVRHSGGNRWISQGITFERWYKVTITYNASTNKTVYDIEGIGSEEVNGNYLDLYFTTISKPSDYLPHQIQLYANAPNTSYNFYKNQTGVKLANLKFKLKDYVSYTVPDFTNVHIGSETCRAYEDIDTAIPPQLGYDYKKISIKRNNKTYSLLCSNTGTYPSQRAKAKIGGTTYSILTKHDLDT